MNKVLIVCGPTATGKTDLGIKLAKILNGEIVSADSRQVYKGMDIGTGKDIPKNLKSQISKIKDTFNKREYILPTYVVDGIPIWMYDVVKPDEEFSVAQYKTYANNVIGDIHKRDKLPIIVGGTGLYIKSIIEPIATIAIPQNKKLRERLDAMTLPQLQKMLEECDTKTWTTLNNSDRNNRRRLVRKIEIAKNSSKDVYRDHIFHDILSIGLTASWEVLTKKIHERVDRRMSDEMVEEIRTLLRHGYTWNLPSMTALGYREWSRFSEWTYGPYALGENEILALWKIHEVQYAHKQMTWFKRDKSIYWFDIKKDQSMQEIISLVTTWYNTGKVNCHDK